MNPSQSWSTRKLSRSLKPYVQTFDLLLIVKIFNKSVRIWEPVKGSILVLTPHFERSAMPNIYKYRKHQISYCFNIINNKKFWLRIEYSIT